MLCIIVLIERKSCCTICFHRYRSTPAPEVKHGREKEKGRRHF